MEQLVEKYASLPQSQRVLLVLGIVGALLAGHYYLIYSSQSDDLKKLRKEHAQKQDFRSQQQGKADNLLKFQAKLADLEEQLETARAKLPDSADVPQLLAQMSAKGRQVGMRIQEFTPGGESAKDFYSEISFNMKVRGSYHEIAMFIDALGKLDRIVNVANLKMQSPKTENSKVVLDAEFLVKTYRFQGNK